jgi:hypothetical protein
MHSLILISHSRTVLSPDPETRSRPKLVVGHDQVPTSENTNVQHNSEENSTTDRDYHEVPDPELQKERVKIVRRGQKSEDYIKYEIINGIVTFHPTSITATKEFYYRARHGYGFLT